MNVVRGSLLPQFSVSITVPNTSRLLQYWNGYLAGGRCRKTCAIRWPCVKQGVAVRIGRSFGIKVGIEQGGVARLVL